jgi:arginine-tRNA-protein transferase
VIELEGDGQVMPTDLPADWKSTPERCGYLPHETSSLDCRIVLSMSAERYETLLERGWRRHGALFFRPACPACSQCRSLRVRATEFRPSKSQRRCWRRNGDVRIELTRPTLSRQHLDLFNSYHRAMQQQRGWPFHKTDASQYACAFLAGDFGFAYEFRFFRGADLIGVGLVDITPRCSSSVYFYHDPQWRSAGPGVFSMMAELRVAARLNLRFHYLGYWIAACSSMSYKSQYRPNELLQAHVGDQENPCWKPATCE